MNPSPPRQIGFANFRADDLAAFNASDHPDFLADGTQRSLMVDGWLPKFPAELMISPDGRSVLSDGRHRIAYLLRAGQGFRLIPTRIVASI